MCLLSLSEPNLRSTTAAFWSCINHTQYHKLGVSVLNAAMTKPSSVQFVIHIALVIGLFTSIGSLLI